MPQPTSTVGTRRKELKLTQTKLAKRLGVTRQYYNAIECSKRTPSVRLAKKLGDILGVDWTIFFDNQVNS